MKFKITQIWRYTEVLEVEAESKADALSKSQAEEFQRCHDDMLIEEVVRVVE